MKYAWITQHGDSFPVSVMCDVLNVSPSGYYDSIDRPSSDRAKRHTRIQQAVEQVHAESHGIYGSQKVAEVLQQRDDLESACRNTVAAAMREMGLKSRICKRFTPTTTQADPTKRPAENKLDRNFAADAPNCKWVTDITYLATATGWVYLAVVVDLFSRKVVGWSIGESLATELVSVALCNRKASARRSATAASQRSRLPIHERRLPKNIAIVGHRMFDEPSWLLLRQRRDGTILLVVEA